MKKTVVLNERKFEYLLTRKKVKNINLRIKPDGSLNVSANRFVSVRTIETFLKSNADKITKSVDRFLSVSENLAKIDFINGECFTILGEQKILTVVEGVRNHAELSNNEITLFVKNTLDLKTKEKTFESFKKSLCEKTVIGICERFYPIFKEKGVPFPKIKFRNMKTRWGSCNVKKATLTFNIKLIEYPEEAIEYVVLHEFAHFLKPDHSKQFYSIIKTYMPDYKERSAILKN